MTGAMGSAAPYSPGEEVAHWLTHAVGVVASLVAIPLLALAAAAGGDAWRLASGVIFGVSALLLFTTSVMYHAVRAPGAKARLRLLDHSAIYLLIAGSYTPFTLGVMRGAWGWTLFGIVWGLAAVGILAKTTLGVRFHLASTLLYLGMGWVGVVAARPLMHALSGYELAWILAGGLAYTAGVPFYLWKSHRYTHAAWHVFVLAGVACHFVAVLSVMSPRPA
jgi:hemolysin III